MNAGRAWDHERSVACCGQIEGGDALVQDGSSLCSSGPGIRVRKPLWWRDGRIDVGAHCCVGDCVTPVHESLLQHVGDCGEACWCGGECECLRCRRTRVLPVNG